MKISAKIVFLLLLFCICSSVMGIPFELSSLKGQGNLTIRIYAAYNEETPVIVYDFGGMDKNETGNYDLDLSPVVAEIRREGYTDLFYTIYEGGVQLTTPEPFNFHAAVEESAASLEISDSGTDEVIMPESFFTAHRREIPEEDGEILDELAVDLEVGKPGFDVNMTADRVGIGTASPSQKLDVAGNVRMTGDLLYGTSDTRTQTKADAGGMGGRSGFYETSAPSPASSWPGGASSWWHLLDIRHSNTTNNYAMQFAGSFFDQDLYFRKTNNSASQAWSKVWLNTNDGSGSGLDADLLDGHQWSEVTSASGWTDGGANVYLVTSGDNVGIGTSSPSYKLDVAGDIGASGDYYGNIHVNDTRAVDSPPSSYNNELALDFKNRSTVGVGGSGTYSGMITLAPWGDNSGDASHQLNLNEGGIFWRQGQPDGATWEAWYRVWTQNTDGSGSNLDADLLDGHDASYFATASGNVTGSGSSNYISKWTGANTQGNSQIYDNGINIGIGTTSPAAKLHMYGDNYTLYGPNSSWGAYLEVGGNGRATSYASVVTTNGNLHIDAANGSFATYINYYSTNNTYINANAGNVGIGTTSPSTKLHVNGSELVTGNSYIGATDAYFYRDAANRIATPNDFYVQASSGNTYLYSTNTYLGNSSGDYIHLRGNQFDWNSGIINTAGYVGIGTTGPTASLHVTGTGYDSTPDVAGTQIAQGLIELTRSGSPGYPYIDFNDGTLGADYDSRLIYSSTDDDLEVRGSDLEVENGYGFILGGVRQTSWPATSTSQWTDAGTYKYVNGNTNVRAYAASQPYGYYASLPYTGTSTYTGYYSNVTGSNAATGYGMDIYSGVYSGGGMGGTYYGVRGKAEWGTTNYGIYGEGASATSASYGVYGTISSSSGTGYAIYGNQGSGNWAGYFNGNVNITGSLSVSGGITGGGDNLGNHTATTTLNMNGQPITNFDYLTPYGIGFDSDIPAQSYAIYQEDGAWTSPYPDLRIAFHTGIKIGAYYSYNGTRFYNNSDMATEIFSIGNTDNNTRCIYNFYAPIMYDINNTGYYIDPASTSYTNYFDRNYGYNGVEYDWNNTAYYLDPASTSICNDFRANIFYDYGNIGYYMDPAATTNLYRIQANADIYNAGWYRGGTADNGYVRLYGNSRQMVFRTDGTTQYADNGGYPFVWEYGGDGSGFRRMILHTDGTIWTSYYGWLHTYIASVVSGSGDNLGNHTATTTLDMTGHDFNSVNDIFCTQNYGRGLVGLYSSTRYQNVFAMGSAYRLSADGTSPGSLYGIAWTHQNIGGESISGLGHQMLIMSAGDTRSAIGDGVWTKYNMTGAQFRDADNTGYYLDPASYSYTNYLDRNYGFNGVEYDWNNTAYYMDPASTSICNDFRANIFYDYGNTAYYMDPASTSICNDFRANIFYDYGNTGYYLDPASYSYLYYIYGSYMQSYIYYDRNNTAYYLDPNGTSNVYHIRVNGIFYDSSGDAGSSGQVLSSTGSGTNWINAPTGEVVGCATPPCGSTNGGVITPSTSSQYAAYSAGTITYWHFAATAGRYYNFSLCINSEDTYLHVYNSSCTEVAANDDAGPHCSGTPASIKYYCSVSGNYTVTACHYTCSAFTSSGSLQYWWSSSLLRENPDGGEVFGPSEVYAKGSSALEDGMKTVTFEPDFTSVAEDNAPTVVVTPTERCSGLFLSAVTSEGFSVEEISGSSNATFNWIAIADPPKPTGVDEYADQRSELKDIYYSDPSVHTYEEWQTLFSGIDSKFPFTYQEYMDATAGVDGSGSGGGSY